MQISLYTISQAKKLNVTVKPSTNKNKKIDVFKDNKKISSIGATGYSDYPTYIKTHLKEYADKRRVLYKLCHEKDRNKVGSNGYYADKLLW
jgi:hypothetical protein